MFTKPQVKVRKYIPKFYELDPKGKKAIRRTKYLAKISVQADLSQILLPSFKEIAEKK